MPDAKIAGQGLDGDKPGSAGRSFRVASFAGGQRSLWTFYEVVNCGRIKEKNDGGAMRGFLPVEYTGTPEILYEDDGLLALSKPAGVLVIPGRGGTDRESLVERLSRERSRKLFVVHRLDREASGLVLFAKDRESHRYLSGLFEARQVRKIYWAVVEGTVDKDGVIDRPVHAFGSGRMGVDDRGKPSETRFRVRERFPGATWLEVEPLTGRRHQIRVHLYFAGHPLPMDQALPGQG